MKWYNVDLWKAIITIPIIMLMLSMFCRCKSKQPMVTQQTYITDKANEKKWDSIFNVRMAKELDCFQASRTEKSEKTLKDFTHIKDSTASRYNSDGKKIGEDRYHSEVRVISEKDVQKLKDSIEKYKEYVDSVKFYHSKADSLNKVLIERSGDKVYVEKKLSKWQNICLQTGKLLFILIFAIVLVTVFNSSKKR